MRVKEEDAVLEYMAFPFEMKEATDEGTFEGYASTFGNVDEQADRIMRGAFERTLKEHAERHGDDPFPLLWQHDPSEPIGGFAATENAKGLKIKGQLLLSVPQAVHARDLALARIVKGLSIGYITKEAERGKNGVRLIKDLDLYEVSLVTFPANRRAGLTALKAADEIASVREFERFLREVGGFSKSEARGIAAHGFRSREQREAEEAAEVVARIQRIKAALATTN